MKALSGLTISVGLLLAATAAHAQVTSPQDTGRPAYRPASDIDEPYANGPPPRADVAPPPRVIYGAPSYGPPPAAYGAPAYGPQGYGPQGYGGPEYGGPPLLPATEIYAVLRHNGFSPLGAPRLRGFFYSVSAIDREGEDGRLVIDARDGRIVRFVPAERFGGYGGGYGGYGNGYYGGAPRPAYGPSYGPLEPMTRLDGPPPRPPAAMQPKIASRMPPTVPVPKAAPARPADDKPLAAKPATPAPAAPKQQSAAVQVKPANTPPAASPAPAEVKPAASVIQPTQPMPKVQGLE
jgi:hypothetical protein